MLWTIHVFTKSNSTNHYSVKKEEFKLKTNTFETNEISSIDAYNGDWR